jgi:hypothetical protein
MTIGGRQGQDGAETHFRFEVTDACRQVTRDGQAQPSRRPAM